MGVKVADPCFQLTAIVAQSLSSAQTLASSKRRIHLEVGRDLPAGRSLACHYSPSRRFNPSAFLGTQTTKLHRSKSCELGEFPKASVTKTTTILQKRIPVRRICSASLNSFSKEEFSKQIQELTLKFRTGGEEENEKKNEGNKHGQVIIHESMDNDDGNYRYGAVELLQESVSGWLDSIEPPWREMANHSIIERKASSVELPLSLRIIKKKLKLEEGLRDAGESAYCSVKRAFASMVFMIEELHSFTLQMSEAIFFEDLQGILGRVQKEMHASFVWLFQCVYYHTPTLMVYVMILLANFTVHSMGSNAAIAAASAPMLPGKTTEASSIVTIQDQTHQKFDISSIRTSNVTSSGCGGKTTSIGGDRGRKLRPAFGGSDGNGWFDGSKQLRAIIPNGVSCVSTFDSLTRNEELFSGQVSIEKELSIWDSMIDEAERMKDPAVDRETRSRLVSPIDANIESDDNTNYIRTELRYQMVLAEEPSSPLLLANYAQFLYLVTRDYDRAEEYFKRGIGSESADAEAFSKYADFLWRAREDVWAAEEMYLEAISADPTNPYHASKYANFLWNTGGEDTCFPLASPETPREMA